MYSVTIADHELDPFAISRRPLHIKNCNNPPLFQQTNTRITLPQIIYDDRKSYCEKINGFQISDPIPEDQAISSSEDKDIYSDHFNRDFTIFSLPDPIEKVPPFMTNNEESKRQPNWMLDLPSSTMHPENKVYYAETLNPTLKNEPPACDVCGEQLEFPFYASLKYNICANCLSNGKIPNNTTSLEFMIVEDPKKATGSWTLEETNRLLSIIEETGDDWQAISQEIKTHSPSECLIHFMRLPMYDQYYIADPLKVPQANFSNDQDSNMIPLEANMLPFMIAPDPIAAFVEFLHILNTRLGNSIAELSQRQIEQILSSKSGYMQFNKVPEVLKNLLKATGEEAGNIAIDNFESLMNSFHTVIRNLEREKSNVSQIVKSGFKEFASISQTINTIMQS